MTLHRLSAGSGIRYLVRHTASGEGPSPPDGLSTYYAASGNPPGRWLGAGLAGLGGHNGIAVGQEVTEAALTAMFNGVDPVTGHLLGRGMSARAVAGFDLTFTVPKSVSVLWALGSPEVQAAVEAAHHHAVHDVLTLIESRCLTTRTGHGGLTQMTTRGAVAAGFDHYDSRAHDPNLHTHLAIANRVQGTDGLWRTIDARGLHAAAVAFSELYDGLLADHLTSTLPLDFGWRSRGIRRDPAFEVRGVDERLIEAFSSRGASIDAAMVSLLTAFETAQGRRPDRVEVIKLRQQATLATRPDKTVTSLPQLRAEWAGRAEEISGDFGPDAVRTALDGPAPLPMPCQSMSSPRPSWKASLCVARPGRPGTSPLRQRAPSSRTGSPRPPIASVPSMPSPFRPSALRPPARPDGIGPQRSRAGPVDQPGSPGRRAPTPRRRRRPDSTHRPPRPA
jgi:conjugative relaxase-like TrwC/TraI family protein